MQYREGVDTQVVPVTQPSLYCILLLNWGITMLNDLAVISCGLKYKIKYPNRITELQQIYLDSSYSELNSFISQYYPKLDNRLKSISYTTPKGFIRQQDFFKFLFPEVKWECLTCECPVGFNATTKSPRQFCSSSCCKKNVITSLKVKTTNALKRMKNPIVIFSPDKVAKYGKYYQKVHKAKINKLRKVYSKEPPKTIITYLLQNYPKLYTKLKGFRKSSQLSMLTVFAFLFPDYRWECNVCTKSHILWNTIAKAPRPCCSPQCSNKDPIKQNKTKATNIERYGFAHPTQSLVVQAKKVATNMERYGVVNPTQNPEIFERAQLSMYRRKPVTIFGVTLMVQGYENVALESIKNKINYVSTDAKEIPRFVYKHKGKQCYYFPDLLVETLDGKQRVIEVKSEWTIKDVRNTAKFKAATKACKKLGMTFWLCLITGRGKDIPRWFKNPTRVPSI